MKAVIAVATAGILMISVWGTLIHMYLSEPEQVSWADHHPERYQADYIREVGEINNYSAAIDSGAETVEEQMQSQSSDVQHYRAHTLDPSDYPEIKEGDGIGFGEGVSVDDLLEDSETFEN